MASRRHHHQPWHHHRPRRTGDGDGIDADGIASITNTGIIRSLNAYSAPAEAWPTAKASAWAVAPSSIGHH
jgi:hypothetical protein